MKYIIVLVSASSQKESEMIAGLLIAAGLCACVNIIPRMRSVYIWKGRKESSTESLMIIKTRSGLFKKLQAAVRKAHSYDTPEIIALPIAEGSRRYLSWIKEVTQ